MTETLPWIKPFPSPAVNRANLPVIATDMPIVFEDEGQEEMGDTLTHYTSESILYFGIAAHLAERADLDVLPNMNLYYHPTNRVAYVSPDVMIVKPFSKLPSDLRTYRIGEEGPAPLLTVEVLSRRTFQQGDLTLKPDIYADIGVSEYLLVDISATFMPEKLRIRRLESDKVWTDEQEPDGGVTSNLGFRVVIDNDGELRVIDAQTGQKYLRPKEAEASEKARRKEEKARLKEEKSRRKEEEVRKKAEQRIRELEAENARLKSMLPPERKD